MIGTTEDFEVEVKRTNIQKSVKQEIKDEGKMVKSLLKEEFGAFKNDTSIAPLEKQKTELQFEFDPEGDNDQTKSNEKTQEKEKIKKQEPSNLLNKLMKKTESDKKKLKEGEFEDDDF